MGQATQIGPEWKEDNRGIFKRWVDIDEHMRLRGEIYWAGAGRWVVTVHLEQVSRSPGGMTEIKEEAQLSRLPAKATLLEAYYVAGEELRQQEPVVRLRGGNR